MIPGCFNFGQKRMKLALKCELLNWYFTLKGFSGATVTYTGSESLLQHTLVQSVPDCFRPVSQAVLPAGITPRSMDPTGGLSVGFQVFTFDQESPQ